MMLQLIGNLLFSIFHIQTMKLCRSKEEVDKWQENDSPIYRFRRYLDKKGWWNDDEEKAWNSEIRKKILKAFNDAEKVKFAPIDEMFNDVYAELPLHLKRQKEELNAHLKKYGKEYPLDRFE